MHARCRREKDQPMDLMIAATALFLGACLGSFANVCIWRIPEEKSIVFPSSHCPKCGKSIRPYDNIPVLSWLILRGRCRDCPNWWIK